MGNHLTDGFTLRISVASGNVQNNILIDPSAIAIVAVNELFVQGNEFITDSTVTIRSADGPCTIKKNTDVNDEITPEDACL